MASLTTQWAQAVSTDRTGQTMAAPTALSGMTDHKSVVWALAGLMVVVYLLHIGGRWADA
ncbi:MAG: hypothetical protein K6T83_07865 [Alicyclobacillus sp.]|nr:hypothetical protein [Alicyclobacillus sp.]